MRRRASREEYANFERMKIFALACTMTMLPLAGCGKSAPSVAAAPAAVAVAPAAAATPVAAAASSAEPALIAVGTKMKCPVSGDEFTVSAKTTQVVYQNKRYAFCCDDCRPEFDKNPTKFAAK